MRSGWLTPLVLSSALVACGGREDSRHIRRDLEPGFTADDFPADEEEEGGPGWPSLGPSGPVALPPPAVSAGSPAQSVCGADGVLQRSISIADQATLDTLEGCERIAGNLTLHLFADIDTAPLLSLRTVDGGLSVHGTEQPLPRLDGFGSLEHVGRLLLSGVYLPDLEPLARLRSIGDPSPSPDFEAVGTPGGRGLEIYNCPGLTSLHGLGALEHVDRIDLNSNADLVSLAGLDNVHAVEELSTYDCPLLDLRGLEQLSVRTLVLFSTALTSLDGLGNAPRLNHFTSSQNAALTSLEGGVFPARMAQLTIEDTHDLTDLRGLEGLRQVEQLYISSTEEGQSSLSSLAGLEQLEQVDYLLLSGLTSLPRLSGLDGLRRILQAQLVGSALVDLAGMPNLQQIDSLELLDAPALTGLLGMGSARLGVLWLLDVPLTNLAGLEQVQLTGESQLQITGAPQLASLQGLPPVATLGTVLIENTPLLQDLQALAGLTELQVLQLRDTGLTQLDALGNLQRLASLYLYDNSQLTQLDGLTFVAGLRELDIRNNDALQTWPGITFSEQTLWVAIADNQSLTAVHGFNNLRSLSLLSIEDNPSLAVLDLSNLESADALLVRGNAALDDEPLAPLRGRLPQRAQVKIVSNLSGPARLSPCPWLNDGVCDEERFDCALGSDTGDCRSWR